ncbi:hypothetical protein B0H19DRAFT_1337407 [Mycena capillaripes]|nr:hypothetical protein B0H19DRAFT_1337407 [Mycena capillaripes]
MNSWLSKTNQIQVWGGSMRYFGTRRRHPASESGDSTSFNHNAHKLLAAKGERAIYPFIRALRQPREWMLDLQTLEVRKEQGPGGVRECGEFPGVALETREGGYKTEGLVQFLEDKLTSAKWDDQGLTTLATNAANGSLQDFEQLFPLISVDPLLAYLPVCYVNLNPSPNVDDGIAFNRAFLALRALRHLKDVPVSAVERSREVRQQTMDMGKAKTCDDVSYAITGELPQQLQSPPSKQRATPPVRSIRKLKERCR